MLGADAAVLGGFEVFPFHRRLPFLAQVRPGQRKLVEGDGLLFVVSVPAAVGRTRLHHPAGPAATAAQRREEGLPGAVRSPWGRHRAPSPPAGDPPRGTATGRGLSQLQDGGTSFRATLAVLRRAALAHWWVLSWGAGPREADRPIGAALCLAPAPRSGTTSGAAAARRQSAPRAGWGAGVCGLLGPAEVLG